MIKLLLTFLISFSILGGAGTFPQGDHIKNLKDKIEFKNSLTQIISNDSDDPSAVAKFGESGSLYLRTNGELWQKQDSGTSTNWTQLYFTPLFTSADKLIKSNGLDDITDTGIDILGTDSLGNVDRIEFDTAVGAPALQEGALFYDNDALAFFNATKKISLDKIESYNTNLSTGLISGGILSIGTPTSTFSVALGNGHIVNSYTDSNNPVITPVSWTAFSNIALTDINASFTTIGLDSAGLIVQRPDGSFTAEETRDYIVIGTLVHQDNVSIDSVYNTPHLSYGGLHSVYDMGVALGSINSEGNTYSGTAVSQIKRTAGKTFELGSNHNSSTKNPNFVESVLADPATFHYHYQDGVGGFIATPDTTTIDKAFWDDGTGTLNSLGNNKWTIQRIYLLPATSVTVLQYGQAEYSNLNDAMNGISTEDFNKDPELIVAKLRALLVFRKGADLSLNDGNHFFIEADKFGQTAQGSASSISSFSSYYVRQLEDFSSIDIASYFTISANVAVAEEITTPIDGVRSAALSQTTATAADYYRPNTMLFNDDVYKNRTINYAFDFNSNALAGSYRVKTILYNGTVERTVSDIDIDTTGLGTFTSEFFVNPIDEYVRFEILTKLPNDANLLIVDNFRLDISGKQVKNFTVTEDATYTGYLSKNGSNQLKFATESSNNSGKVISVTNTDHTRYTFEREGDFTASAAIYNGATDDQFIEHYSSLNVLKKKVILRDTVNGRVSSATTGYGEIGDYIVVVSTGTPSNDTLTNFSITATATSEGTVYSDEIDNSEYNWNSFTPTGSWTTNTTYTGAWRRDAGDIEIVYRIAISTGPPNNSTLDLDMPSGKVIDTSVFDYGVDGSEIPILDSDGGAFDAGSGYSHLKAHWSSTTKFQVWGVANPQTDNSTRVAQGTPRVWDNADRIYMHIKVPIVGWSANPIKNIIVENPEGEFSTVTKILSANATANAVVSDLTLTTVVGESYQLNVNTNFGLVDNSWGRLQIDNGATAIGRVAVDNSNIAAASGTAEISRNATYNFTATDTTVTFTMSSFTLSSYLSGTGTKLGSYVELVKLPKKLGVDVLENVITDHVSGGTEYEVKGELFDGKQVYARSWELISDLSAGANIDTGLPTTLEPLHGEVSTNLWLIFNYGFSSTFARVVYDKGTGNIVFAQTGGGTLLAGTRLTFKYTKP